MIEDNSVDKGSDTAQTCREIYSLLQDWDFILQWLFFATESGSVYDLDSYVSSFMLLILGQIHFWECTAKIILINVLSKQL